MTVFLDDVAVQLDGERLGEVLISAQQRLEPAGRIIVEVKLDGKAVVGDDVADRQEEPLSDRDLRMTSADPRELTLMTLTQVREELDTLRQLQSEAAEQLQQDQPAEALRQFGEALNVWLAVQQAVLHASQVMDIDLDAMIVADQTLADRVEQLRQQLEEVKDMIVHGDTVALADALAYEWPQTVDRWDALISQLIDQIESRSASS